MTKAMGTYLSETATTERRDRLKPVLSFLKQQLQSHIASDSRVVKIGGQGNGKARWNSAGYPKKFFDCDEEFQMNAKISSKADGIYLETELINFAKFNLQVLGVNSNGVAVLNKGAEYSDEKPGSIYMVPVKSTIRTQAEFNSTYQSYYKKMQDPDFVPYNPETRKQQVPAERKQQVPAERKQTKKSGPKIGTHQRTWTDILTLADQLKINHPDLFSTAKLNIQVFRTHLAVRYDHAKKLVAIYSATATTTTTAATATPTLSNTTTTTAITIDLTSSP